MIEPVEVGIVGSRSFEGWRNGLQSGQVMLWAYRLAGVASHRKQ